MKIIEYSIKRPKVDEVQIQFDPMVVWLDSHTEVRIERGDRLGVVARKVAPYFDEYLTMAQVEQLVAYWFAMGERASRERISKPWKRRETKVDRDRRYLRRSE